MGVETSTLTAIQSLEATLTSAERRLCELEEWHVQVSSTAHQQRLRGPPSSQDVVLLTGPVLAQCLTHQISILMETAVSCTLSLQLWQRVSLTEGEWRFQREWTESCVGQQVSVLRVDGLQPNTQYRLLFYGLAVGMTDKLDFVTSVSPLTSQQFFLASKRFFQDPLPFPTHGLFIMPVCELSIESAVAQELGLLMEEIAFPNSGKDWQQRIGDMEKRIRDVYRQFHTFSILQSDQHQRLPTLFLAGSEESAYKLLVNMYRDFVLNITYTESVDVSNITASLELGQLMEKERKMWRSTVAMMNKFAKELRIMLLSTVARLLRRTSFEYFRLPWNESYKAWLKFDLELDMRLREVLEDTRQQRDHSHNKLLIEDAIARFNSKQVEGEPVDKANTVLNSISNKIASGEQHLNSFARYLVDNQHQINEHNRNKWISLLNFDSIGLIMIEPFWSYIRNDGIFDITNVQELSIDEEMFDEINKKMLSLRSKSDGAASSANANERESSLQMIIVLCTTTCLSNLTIQFQIPKLLTAESNVVFNAPIITPTDAFELLRNLMLWQSEEKDTRSVLLVEGNAEQYGRCSVRVAEADQETLSTSSAHLQQIFLPREAPFLRAKHTQEHEWMLSLAETETNREFKSAANVLYGFKYGLSCPSLWQITYATQATSKQPLLDFSGTEALQKYKSESLIITLGPVIKDVTASSATVLLEVTGCEKIDLVCLDQLSGLQYLCTQVKKTAATWIEFIFTDLQANHPYEIYLVYSFSQQFMKRIGSFTTAQTLKATYSAPPSTESRQLLAEAAKEEADRRTKADSIESSTEEYEDDKNNNGNDDEDSLPDDSGAMGSDTIRILFCGSIAADEYCSLLKHLQSLNVRPNASALNALSLLNHILCQPWNGLDTVIHTTCMVNWQKSIKLAAERLQTNSNLAEMRNNVKDLLRESVLRSWNANITARSLLSHGNHEFRLVSVLMEILKIYQYPQVDSFLRDYGKDTMLELYKMLHELMGELLGSKTGQANLIQTFADGVVLINIYVDVRESMRLGRVTIRKALRELKRFLVDDEKYFNRARTLLVYCPFPIYYNRDLDDMFIDEEEIAELLDLCSLWALQHPIHRKMDRIGVENSIMSSASSFYTQVPIPAPTAPGSQGNQSSSAPLSRHIVLLSASVDDGSYSMSVQLKLSLDPSTDDLSNLDPSHVKNSAASTGLLTSPAIISFEQLVIGPWFANTHASAAALDYATIASSVFPRAVYHFEPRSVSDGTETQTTEGDSFSGEQVQVASEPAKTLSTIFTARHSPFCCALVEIKEGVLTPRFVNEHELYRFLGRLTKCSILARPRFLRAYHPWRADGNKYRVHMKWLEGFKGLGLQIFRPGSHHADMHIPGSPMSLPSHVTVILQSFLNVFHQMCSDDLWLLNAFHYLQDKSLLDCARCFSMPTDGLDRPRAEALRGSPSRLRMSTTRKRTGVRMPKHVFCLEEGFHDVCGVIAERMPVDLRLLCKCPSTLAIRYAWERFRGQQRQRRDSDLSHAASSSSRDDLREDRRFSGLDERMVWMLVQHNYEDFYILCCMSYFYQLVLEMLCNEEVEMGDSVASDEAS